MIDQLEFLYHAERPDLLAPDYLGMIRRVTRTELWLRWALALIGASLAVGSMVMIALPGHLTAAGWFAVVLLLGSGFLSLRFLRTLRTDTQPYSLPIEVLGRYIVTQGRITGFGTPATFGSSFNRYERLYWTVDGPRESKGGTPYVKSALSIWLDYDDRVWIGLDPAGECATIFLGVAKPPPAVLALQKEADAQAVYLALQEHFRDSRRWKGKPLPSLWIR